jgi:hypothetical protein
MRGSDRGWTRRSVPAHWRRVQAQA